MANEFGKVKFMSRHEVKEGFLLRETRDGVVLEKLTESGTDVVAEYEAARISVEVHFEMCLRDAREYVRQMFRLASEVTLDNQGRILISSKLIALAGLKKECVFVGANKYIELWDQERWEAHNETVESLDELAERINGTV